MKKIFSLVMCCIIALSLAGCKKMETDDKTASENVGTQSSATSETGKKNPLTLNDIVIPEIKSDDSVMPTYVDISIYDEENYADVYLGEDFKYDVTYDGIDIVVPTTYDNMIAQGWKLDPSAEHTKDSQIMVGKSLEIDFINENNKKITAVFYNEGITSATLGKCPLVKFIIKENSVLKSNSQYGTFKVNGVSNASAITDIIEVLGAPSHFYKVTENQYYLDWFITKKDRRSEITIYVNTAEDHIDAIQFSYY